MRREKNYEEILLTLGQVVEMARVLGEDYAECMLRRRPGTVVTEREIERGWGWAVDALGGWRPMHARAWYVLRRSFVRGIEGSPFQKRGRAN